MGTLFINIKNLIGVKSHQGFIRGKELKNIEQIEDAYLYVEEGLIQKFGPMYELELFIKDYPNDTIDASGRIIMPAWCDSHTHIVFAGTREQEFVDKLNGLSYAEIAAKGGGILNSAAKLRDTHEDVLFDLSKERLRNLKKLGTGAIEIKSGYGLTLEAELKMLRVIQRLKQTEDIPVKASFLGAHSIPMEYKANKEGYIRLIIDEMLPAIAKEDLADYVDVFCETGFYSAEETTRICEAAAKYGLRAKLHVNQLNSIGGIEAGMAMNALSLDHLETLTDQEIELLGTYEGSSTLLPTAAYFLRIGYQPARRLIEAGAAVTLASDFNPGSSPSGNMNFVASLSCIQMKMLPEEVINAATHNGACAMELQAQTGSISEGNRANLIMTKKIPSYIYLMYSFGENNIEQVMLNGYWQ